MFLSNKSRTPCACEVVKFELHVGLQRDSRVLHKKVQSRSQPRQVLYHAVSYLTDYKNSRPNVIVL